MTIGTASVNNLLTFYRYVTLIPLAVFALYDARYHKVRNCALLCFLPWSLASIPLMLTTEPFPWSWIILKSISGFITGGGILFLASYFTDGGIGGGDIKLAAILGILYGGSTICFILGAASLLLLIYWLSKTITGGSKKMHISFVPFLFTAVLLITLIN